MELTKQERLEVEHWRRWVSQGGTKLLYAPMALEPLIAIVDRLTKPSPQETSDAP